MSNPYYSVGKSKHHQWCADSTSFKLHGSEEERRECRLMRCQQNETANAMTFFLLEVGGPETRQESRIWHKMDQVFLYRVWPQAWIFISQKRLQMVWIRCLQTHDEDIFFRWLLKFQLSLPFFRIVYTHTGIHIKVWLDRATLPCNGQKLVFGKYWCNLTFIGVTGQLQTLMERTYDLSYQIQVLGGFRNRWRDSTRDANVRESYQIRLLSSLPHSPKLTFDLNSSSNHSCCASNWV